MKSMLNSIINSVNLLNNDEKKTLGFLAFLQATLGVLDVLGLLLTSLFIAFVVSTSTSQEPSTLINGVLTFLKIEEFEPTSTIATLSILTLFVFLLKSLLSRIIHGNYEWLRKQSPIALSQALISGVSSATVSTLGHTVLLFSELVLMLLLFFLTIFISPFIGIALILYLLGVIYVLNKLVGAKVSMYNARMNLLKIQSEADLHNSLKLIREIKILDRFGWFEKKSSKSFSEYSGFLAQDIWIQQLPKYVLEVAMLLGSALILGVGSMTSTASNVITTLAIYLAISTRLFPSLLRIQNSLSSLFAFKGLGDDFYSLFQEKMIGGQQDKHLQQSSSRVSAASNFRIEVEGLSFRYQGSQLSAISNLNFVIEEGEKVGIVGPSGSGKTTLSDILLGLLEPTNGNVKIGGTPTRDYLRQFPGSLAYLPQDITFTSGTVLQNICIGLESNGINLQNLQKILDANFFKDVIESLPNGVNTLLSTDAKSISGGQRQRIGIARTLYSEPKIVVMDEATSSLDADSEWSVMSSISELGDGTTLVFIAHRLSSLVNFDRIIYLEAGKIVAEGNFSELRNKVESFDRQARLLGL